MATKSSPHLDQETLEKYSMRRLYAKVAARVEEHLLICEICRKELEASDAYVASMRQASANLRREERQPKRKAVRKGSGSS